MNTLLCYIARACTKKTNAFTFVDVFAALLLTRRCRLNTAVVSFPPAPCQQAIEGREPRPRQTTGIETTRDAPPAETMPPAACGACCCQQLPLASALAVP